MEPSAQAWWLLEGGIGARRRVIRSILIRGSSAARWLGEAVKVAGPAGKASDYGEDQARVRAYAEELGISYVCNDKRTERDGETLPGYTKRATSFEKAVGVAVDTGSSRPDCSRHTAFVRRVTGSRSAPAGSRHRRLGVRRSMPCARSLPWSAPGWCRTRAARIRW